MLIDFGEQLARFAEEIVLSAFALTSRASAYDQAAAATGRLAEFFVAFQSLLDPVPPLLLGGPGEVAKPVFMTPFELRELVMLNEASADEENRIGNEQNTRLHRERAAQLRQVLGEAQP